MKAVVLFVCFALITTLMTGCFLLPAEEPFPPPPTIFVPPERTYLTVPVMRGDVRLESTVTAQYSSAKVVKHHFTEDDIPVLGIFVTLGGEVLEGDILAALDVLELESEYEELSFKREYSILELTLLEERQKLLSRQAANAGRTLDNASYLWERDTLRLNISHLDELIEHIEQQKEGRYLRASMDGIVTTVTFFTEGMYSDKNVTIAAISDFSATLFVVSGDWAMEVNPGDRFEMTLGNEVHLMEVVDPDDHGIDEEAQSSAAFLSFVNDPPAPGFEATGTIHILLGEATDVLYIPLSVLRRTDERNFVYVLDESGLRTIRDVVPGFQGKDHIEILSGLMEGELVIR